MTNFAELVENLKKRISILHKMDTFQVEPAMVQVQSSQIFGERNITRDIPLPSSLENSWALTNRGNNGFHL